ncbi:MAG: hypothetical protein Q7O66_06975, partial [Dehalococcoidia bacterium]|nr:hypothetical protein [Dehalococcoidia bacterium]
MKVSLKWLREYVDITETPGELAHKLAMAGTEVSETKIIGGNWEHVVVGQVTKLDKHPNADRL